MVVERKHRLQKEFYNGELSVAFTLCLRGNVQSSVEPVIAEIFKKNLTVVLTKDVLFLLTVLCLTTNI